MSEQKASSVVDAQAHRSKAGGRKPGKSASKSARSRAREFALQALYQVIKQGLFHFITPSQIPLRGRFHDRSNFLFLI